MAWRAVICRAREAQDPSWSAKDQVIYAKLDKALAQPPSPPSSRLRAGCRLLSYLPLSSSPFIHPWFKNARHKKGLYFSIKI